MKDFRYALFLFLCLLLLRSSADAQPGAVNPQLLDCGRHGDVEVICGTNAPEDFELTPDGRFLIVAKMGRDENKGLDLFDPAARTFAPIPLSAEKKPDWGEDACTESIGGRDPASRAVALKTNKRRMAVVCRQSQHTRIDGNV